MSENIDKISRISGRESKMEDPNNEHQCQHYITTMNGTAIDFIN